MEKLLSNEPTCQRLIFSFLDFMQKNVELAPGADPEALEVAIQCLSQVFKVDTTNDAQRRQLATVPLVSIHPAHQAIPETPYSPTHDAPARESSQVSQDMEYPSMQAASSGASPSALGQPPSTARFTSNGATSAEATSAEGTAFGGPQAEAMHAASLKAKRLKEQGNAAVAERRFEDAIKLYTHAICLDGNCEIYYANRAAALQHLGRYQEAVTDCKRAIAIEPSYSKAYSRLGQSLLALGHYKDAIDKGFRKAVEVDPTNQMHRKNLVAAEEKLREFQTNQGGGTSTSPHHQQQGQTHSQNSYSQDAPPRGSAPDNSTPPILHNPAEYLAWAVRQNIITSSQASALSEGLSAAFGNMVRVNFHPAQPFTSSGQATPSGGGGVGTGVPPEQGAAPGGVPASGNAFRIINQDGSFNVETLGQAMLSMVGGMGGEAGLFNANSAGANGGGRNGS